MTDNPLKFAAKPKAAIIKDSDRGHWVNRAPLSVRPFLQLSRLDRPVGYWLLTLPGWMGLAFARISYEVEPLEAVLADLKWALLIFIGAVAMRGAGCTYNDIVDQDLDRQVARTALRPLPAGTVTTRQAWAWLLVQCFIGLFVLLALPRLAQYISLLSIPLVAAYPFMKRITWFPQLWLGMTFNWAVLVAYAAKTGTVSTPLFILYAGLIFWTVGYDTIYACQDIEDDMKIGVKSTARRFGKHVKLGIGLSYLCAVLIMGGAVNAQIMHIFYGKLITPFIAIILASGILSIFALHLLAQTIRLEVQNSEKSLRIFKSNVWAALCFIVPMGALSHLLH